MSKLLNSIILVKVVTGFRLLIELGLYVIYSHFTARLWSEKLITRRNFLCLVQLKMQQFNEAKSPFYFINDIIEILRFVIKVFLI